MIAKQSRNLFDVKQGIEKKDSPPTDDGCHTGGA